MNSAFIIYLSKEVVFLKVLSFGEDLREAANSLEILKYE